MEYELLKEKVKVYEQLLHSIQMYACVTQDNIRLNHIIAIACDWSYAHRAGNGELSEEEQNEAIEHEFERMKHKEWLRTNNAV